MSLSEELERLQSLRERGALSEEEYARAKAQVLENATRAAGSATPAGQAPHPSLLHRLARSRTDRLIGGVCGGLGKHTDLPSWAWRVIFCVVSLYFGAGLLFYILLWIFLPLEPA
jgi:phage shock protein C